MLKNIIRKYKEKKRKEGFKYIGTDTQIPFDLIVAGKRNISIGNHVSIGPRCLFYSTRAALSLGNHVMIGPEVMMISGDHRFDIEGIYMDEVTNDMKLPENDQPITIEDDCWIGARVLILKGVSIGKGSIIAAGAIVLKNVPPYSIYYNKNDIRPRFK